RLRQRAEQLAGTTPSAIHRGTSYVLAAIVAILSLGPVGNMISPGQAMNSSFEPLALVNTYGAFGSVGRERYEVILQGTDDAELSARTVWREYEFPCKPGDARRSPCIVTPYHERLDWQMWFAALSSPERQPWIVHLVYRLLHGDRGIRTLLARDPFPDR